MNRTQQFKNVPHISALSIACLLACQPAAWAGSASGEYELPTVTVTGSGTPAVGALPRHLPANSAGFSAQELEEQVNVINTEDIVKYSPDTMTRKRYIGDRNAIIQTRTASVTSSARSLVYADGVLLSNLLGNSFAYPARWNMVLPEEVKRVDFFFGPYSAAYPGNSTGTTVLMTTRMPDKFEATGKVQTFSEHFKQYDHSSVNSGGAISATVGNKAGDLSWLLGFHHLESTGHPMQYGAVGATTGTAGTPVTGWKQDTDPTGAKRILIGEFNQEETTQNSFKAKLVYDLTSKLKIAYTVGAWTNDSFNHAASYLKDANGNTVSSGTVNMGGSNYKIDANSSFSQNTWSQEHWMQALSLKTNTRDTWHGEAVFTSYRIAQDLQHVSRPDGDAGPSTTPATTTKYYGNVNVNPFGDGWKTLDLRGTWRPVAKAGASRHEVSLGYHFDQYTLNSKSYLSDFGDTGLSSWQGAPQSANLKSSSTGETRTQAVYVQDAWRFMPGWMFTPGVRFENWQALNGANQRLISGVLQSKAYSNRHENYTSPKLALQFAANDDWLLKASWGEAYRMPTVTELFQSLTVGNQLTPNNPALRPERAISTELTAERALEDGLLRISLFSENMSDAIFQQRIVIDGTPNIPAATNIDHVLTQGATLAYQKVNAIIRGLDMTGSLTYAKSRIHANSVDPSVVGNVFPGVPDWRATVVGTYHASSRLSYTLAARYSGYQANQLNNKDVDQNVYGANSKFFVVDARVNWRIGENWRISAGIDNLNNEAYYAFHPMPQRTFHLELKASM
jgi:iron complex outermembrane receptor protein